MSSLPDSEANQALDRASHCNQTSTLQCVIPPHMVDSIALRGNASQKKMAADLQKLCEQTRRKRVMHTQSSSGAPVGQQSARGATPAAMAKPARPIRRVYDAQNQITLPGELAREEGQDAVADASVNRAYDGAGDTYRMLLEVYGRDSIDGSGMALVSSVHVLEDYNNAFWNGQQMAYGDGDGKLFLDFTNSLGVIGHEFAHGVIQFSGGLIYQDQSGALNEHIADVLGGLVDQYKHRQPVAEASWLVGEEILGPEVTGTALRSLRAPGTAYQDNVLGRDPQPFHMDHFVNTTSDNGGVHINSGIPNHAFFLASMLVGGNAWEHTGQIWYDALQTINNPHAQFSDWANETVEAARSRFGVGSREGVAVRRAWKLVGIPL